MRNYSSILLATIITLIIFLIACLAPELVIYVAGGITIGMCVLASSTSAYASHCRRISGGNAIQHYKSKTKTFSPILQGDLDDKIKEYKLTKFDGDYYTQDEITEIKKVYSDMYSLSDVKTLVKDLPNNIPYRSLRLNRTVKQHFGQRKLLLSEVDFLSDYVKEGDTVVYAGAAPGTHTTFLARLFEPLKLKWHLYDPREFIAAALDFPGGGYIKIFNQYYTDDDAKGYAGRNDVLFISDIRTFDGIEMPSEDYVDNDMELQENWVRLMAPRAAMLKFRLRYNKVDNIDKSTYLDGEIRIQAWAPTASTETRLIVTEIKNKDYSISDYDAKLAYLNGVVREWMSFDNGIPSDLVKGIDTCFDCALETIIWRKFASKFATANDAGESFTTMSKDEQAAAIATLFNRASKAIGRGIYEPPHGLHPDVLKKDVHDTDAIYLHHSTKIRKAKLTAPPGFADA